MVSMMHALRPARLVTYWAIMFVILYISTFFLYGMLLATYNPLIFFSVQFFGPFMYLLFSWLYFRKVGLNTWLSRLSVGVLWIALTLLASALLMPLIYGYDWRYAINVGVLNTQLLNIAAVLVGGFAATHRVPKTSL